MGTYSSVACDEVFSTVGETLSSGGMSAKVQLRCTWANRGPLMRDLIYTPRPYPEDANLVATSATAKPEPSKYTASDQQIVYQNALVDVTYSVPGSEDGGGQPQDPVKLISESIEPYTKAQTLAPEEFEWADGTKLKDGEEPGKIVHGIRLVRQIFYVPTISNTILTLPGSVHNKAYISALLGQTFPAGTLLFIPPVMSRTITTAGATAWNLRLGWDYKEDGWNKYWRLSTSTYQSILLKGGGAYESFPEKDHGAFLF